MTIYPENDAPLSPDIWTVQRVLGWAVPWLKEKLPDLNCSPRLDAELLLANVLKIDRTNLFLQLDRPLTKPEKETFKTLVRRRAESEPVAYIIGYRDFYRHRFKVTDAVLIPRPDTESLVETVVTAARSMNSPRILEVGTGSGCVAVSLAADVPTSIIEAWDVSESALNIARSNAACVGVANISFKVQDALAFNALPVKQFDFIVSNPPYIASDERSLMSSETLRYEPRLALFPADSDGLTFYRAFATYYGQCLLPGGKIFLEVGVHQAARVAQLFIEAGWQKIKIVKDLSGCERVISAECVEV